MKNQLNLFEDNLITTRWLGRVVDVADPDFEGKIRVQVFGKFDELEIEQIPWSIPANIFTGGSSTGGGFHSIPKLDSIVEIKFDNGNIYLPRWSYLNRLSDEVKERFGTEELYENATSLFYDTEANLYFYFIPTEGFFIRTVTDDEESNEFFISAENLIRLKNVAGSFIELRDDESVITKTTGGTVLHTTNNGISLGAEDESDFHAVLFEELDKWQDDLIDAIGKIVGITTPTGPTGPLNGSATWAAVEALKKSKENFKSKIITLNKE